MSTLCTRDLSGFQNPKGLDFGQSISVKQKGLSRGAYHDKHNHSSTTGGSIVQLPLGGIGGLDVREHLDAGFVDLLFTGLRPGGPALGSQ